MGIYLHLFINNEREISIPHEALPSAELKILRSLIIVTERVQVNPDNS